MFYDSEMVSFLHTKLIINAREIHMWYFVHNLIRAHTYVSSNHREYFRSPCHDGIFSAGSSGGGCKDFRFLKKNENTFSNALPCLSFPVSFQRCAHACPMMYTWALSVEDLDSLWFSFSVQSFGEPKLGRSRIYVQCSNWLRVRMSNVQKECLFVKQKLEGRDYY